jgi:hypothetical protein
VGLVAVVVGTRSTVIDGRVMAGRLFEQLKAQEPGYEAVDCDDEIPIGHHGARFSCTLHANGEAMDVEYEMSRDGSMLATPLVARVRRP